MGRDTLFVRFSALEMPYRLFNSAYFSYVTENAGLHLLHAKLQSVRKNRYTWAIGKQLVNITLYAIAVNDTRVEYKQQTYLERCPNTNAFSHS